MDVKLTKKLKSPYWDFLVHRLPDQLFHRLPEKLLDLLSMPNIRRSPLLSSFQLRFSFFYHSIITETEAPAKVT